MNDKSWYFLFPPSGPPDYQALPPLPQLTPRCSRHSAQAGQAGRSKEELAMVNINNFPSVGDLRWGWGSDNKTYIGAITIIILSETNYEVFKIPQKTPPIITQKSLSFYIPPSWLHIYSDWAPTSHIFQRADWSAGSVWLQQCGEIAAPLPFILQVCPPSQVFSC